MVITIDGPVAAGKTTTAQRLAAVLGLPLLDTGAIYRSVALAAARTGINWADESSVAAVASELELRFGHRNGLQQVYLANEEVTEVIRGPEISSGASIVSAHPAVRDALLALQRQQATDGELIAEGRDTGTVVFPAADYKFFLTATLEERVRRRFVQWQRQGLQTDLESVRVDIRRRDDRDSNRAVAPLIAAPDAVEIDSTSLSLDGVVETVCSCIGRASPTSAP